jgi:hypothetical protein
MVCRELQEAEEQLDTTSQKNQLLQVQLSLLALKGSRWSG